MARARCHDLDPAVELDYDMTQDPGLSPVLAGGAQPSVWNYRMQDQVRDTQESSEQVR